MTGLAVQLSMVGGLAATVGVGPAGWAVAGAYGLAMYLGLTRGLGGDRPGPAGTGDMFGPAREADVFGPANWVTLTRATLVGAVAALTADSFHRPAPVGLLVTIVVVALVLDAVDGQVARRTGTATGLGARFDMEVDAFLILVLSVYVARTTGAWVLAIGVMRYAFLAAGWGLRWMRAPLPPRFWRKVVAAVQGVVLVFATADVLPAGLTVAALVVALVLLVESFGRDVAWLWLRSLSHLLARLDAMTAPGTRAAR